MPIYQTASDVQNEVSTIGAIERRSDIRFLQVKSVTSPIDWVAYKDTDGLTHLVEVKNRTNHLSKYPTYMIDKKKVDTLQSLGDQLGIGSLVIVGFLDYVAIAKASDIVQNSTVGIGGRYDRGDKNDIDEVYYFPVDRFKKIPKD